MPTTKQRPSNGSGMAAQFQAFMDRLNVEKAKGPENAQHVIALLEGQLNRREADNYDLRKKNRELRDASEAAAKVPDDKVLVDKKAWEAGEAAVKAITEIGVTAKDLPDAFRKGRDAMLATTTDAVAKAEKLNDAGARALKQLVTDHKLTVLTSTAKVDGKDVEQAYIEHEGKRTPLKQYLEEKHAPYVPGIYAAPADVKTPAAPNTERRMPATGKTSDRRPDAGATGNLRTAAANATLARYGMKADTAGAGAP